MRINGRKIVLFITLSLVCVMHSDSLFGAARSDDFPGAPREARRDFLQGPSDHPDRRLDAFNKLVREGDVAGVAAQIRAHGYKEFSYMARTSEYGEEQVRGTLIDGLRKAIAINIAVENDDSNMVNLLLSYGVKLGTENTSLGGGVETALGIAIRKKNTEMVKRLLSAGHPPVAVNKDPSRRVLAGTRWAEVKEVSAIDYARKESFRMPRDVDVVLSKEVRNQRRKQIQQVYNVERTNFQRAYASIAQDARTALERDPTNAALYERLRNASWREARQGLELLNEDYDQRSARQRFDEYWMTLGNFDPANPVIDFRLLVEEIRLEAADIPNRLNDRIQALEVHQAEEEERRVERERREEERRIARERQEAERARLAAERAERERARLEREAAEQAEAARQHAEMLENARQEVQTQNAQLVESLNQFIARDPRGIPYGRLNVNIGQIPESAEQLVTQLVNRLGRIRGRTSDEIVTSVQRTLTQLHTDLQTRDDRANRLIQENREMIDGLNEYNTWFTQNNPNRYLTYRNRRFPDDFADYVRDYLHQTDEQIAERITECYNAFEADIRALQQQRAAQTLQQAQDLTELEEEQQALQAQLAQIEEQTRAQLAEMLPEDPERERLARQLAEIQRQRREVLTARETVRTTPIEQIKARQQELREQRAAQQARVAGTSSGKKASGENGDTFMGIDKQLLIYGGLGVGGVVGAALIWKWLQKRQAKIKEKLKRGLRRGHSAASAA